MLTPMAYSGPAARCNRNRLPVAQVAVSTPTPAIQRTAISHLRLSTSSRSTSVRLGRGDFRTTDHSFVLTLAPKLGPRRWRKSCDRCRTEAAGECDEGDDARQIFCPGARAPWP